ncbi:RluA family pseudouridine synthase [Phormidium sp. CLA17]|uniref:RluA family pseudouridine synthase n=1 Tax=Leptolyngbya sp. Cla-17 TaxID=2803751 RepID=UPI001491BD3F|nr:RluA family pseudouridine synthase [Leptolyngbya sp. Cla-17]MBM0743099.1 RluA family pseudouridine synthase [Leptolyngbya sp. Cla-17]
MNHGWIYREQIKRSDAGLTVLDYYTQRYRHSSRDEWHQRIAQGQVLLDEQPSMAETVLQPEQWLAYHRPPWEEPEVPLEFAVLYEDEDLLVIAKPSGLPVLPGGGFLEHTLLGQLHQQYPHDTPAPIHRLGRGTSGLMLLARSPLAKAHLSQQLRKRQIHKVYRALVGVGEMPDQFTITQPIGKIPHPVLGYIYGAAPDGLSAHSQVQVLKRQSNSTLLEVTILTGRPHQIRIHLATAGFPLLGDPLYVVGGIPLLKSINGDEQFPVPGDCGYHLHAYHLRFIHPKTKDCIHITCPAPAELD